MYRYDEGTDFVFAINNVYLRIPTANTLTEEQALNADLCVAHEQYLAFIEQGGVVLPQDAEIDTLKGQP